MTAKAAQQIALGHAQRMGALIGEIQAKLVSSDMAGAQARLAFLLREAGNCLEEINAARGRASSAAGMLPRLPVAAPEESEG